MDNVIERGDLINEKNNTDILEVLHLVKETNKGSSIQVTNLSADDNIAFAISTTEGEYMVRELFGSDKTIYDIPIFRDKSIAPWVPKLAEVYHTSWGGLYGKYEYFDGQLIPVDLVTTKLPQIVADLDEASKDLKKNPDVVAKVKRDLIKRVRRIGIVSNQRAESHVICDFINTEFHKGHIVLGFADVPTTLKTDGNQLSVGCLDRLVPQFRRNLIINGVNYSTKSINGGKIKFMTELTDVLKYTSRNFSYQSTGNIIKVDLQYFIDKYIK